MNTLRTSAMVVFLLATGCSLKPPPPGLDLTDGCYYVGSVPVLKIKDREGRFLIPGNMTKVQVDHEHDENSATAIFSPGFTLDREPSLKVRQQNQFPSYYMMMKPYTATPVIMVPTDPLGLIDLERGTPC
ncbi:hypothetical protein [Rhizorhabdus argentea]|uniref:hypothetical protein n=1 Tax=Rhizorhabdus argentea TaxID=1387174 RepID=UPI0030ED1C52